MQSNGPLNQVYLKFKNLGFNLEIKTLIFWQQLFQYELKSNIDSLLDILRSTAPQSWCGWCLTAISDSLQYGGVLPFFLKELNLVNWRLSLSFENFEASNCLPPLQAPSLKDGSGACAGRENLILFNQISIKFLQ